MPITVQVEDERGAPVGALWSHPLATRLLVGEHPGTCCLRFIGAHGDTVFNQAQLPVLLAELRAFGAQVRQSELAPVLRELVTFVLAAAGQAQVFVRFVGD